MESSSYASVTQFFVNVCSHPVIRTVSVAFLVWVGLYSALILKWPGQKREWHCRIVTTGHAVTAITLSAWCVFVQGPWPFTKPAGPNTPLQEFTCAISIGYFIFDFLWCIYFQTEGPVMLFHHALTMLGETMVLGRGINGCEAMATLLATEFTNPLLQLRWFLRHSSTDVPWYYKEVVDLLFLALFTFIRVGVGSLYLFFYLSHPLPDAIAKAGAVTLYLVGWVFWVGLLRYVWRTYVLRLTYPSKSGKSPCDGEKEGESVAVNNSEDVTDSQSKSGDTTGDSADHVILDQTAAAQNNKVSSSSEVYVECRHRTVLTEEVHTL